MTDEEFWDNVSVSSDNECWEWVGTLNDHGYGRLNYRGKDDRSHRVSWRMKNGDIPDNLFVLHKCDNRKCVNPNHLFLGTQLDNMQDMSRKGRGKPFVGIGSRNPKSKLTENDVLTIRKLHQNKNYTCVQLSKMYKVTDVQISAIIHRKAWKHI